MKIIDVNQDVVTVELDREDCGRLAEFAERNIGATDEVVNLPELYMTIFQLATEAMQNQEHEWLEAARAKKSEEQATAS